MPNLELMNIDELLDCQSRDKFVQEEAIVLLGLLQRGLITSVKAELTFKDGKKTCTVEHQGPSEEYAEGIFTFKDADGNVLGEEEDVYEASPYFF